MLSAAGITLANALTRHDQERSFWVMLTLGFLLWASNQGAWIYYDIVLHSQLPDPTFFDIILFFHAVPFIAAIVWRPDLSSEKASSISAC